MSAPWTLLSPSCKVYIAQADLPAFDPSATKLAVISGKWRQTTDKVDISDAESGILKQDATGLIQTEINLTGNQAQDFNPFTYAFGGVTQLQPGSIVSITLDFTGKGSPPVGANAYPDGTIVNYLYVQFFRILEVSGDWQMAGSRPQTFSISGESTTSTINL